MILKSVLIYFNGSLSHSSPLFLDLVDRLLEVVNSVTLLPDHFLFSFPVGTFVTLLIFLKYNVFGSFPTTSVLWIDTGFEDVSGRSVPVF